MHLNSCVAIKRAVSQQVGQTQLATSGSTGTLPLGRRAVDLRWRIRLCLANDPAGWTRLHSFRMKKDVLFPNPELFGISKQISSSGTGSLKVPRFPAWVSKVQCLGEYGLL